MWIELVKSLEPESTFRPPATNAEISKAEEMLKVKFPEELSELLLEANGIVGKYGMGLVWAADRIATENITFRTYPGFPELYMPFDPLLFFADAADGDQFAFRILNGSIPYFDVYVWNHETDSRVWAAPSLKEYLKRWLNGTLEI